MFRFRLFNASYDLPFSVINSSAVFFDQDTTGLVEFNNILHLWLKPILKAFGSDFVRDTIPKHIEFVLRGTSYYGVSSPNSNLVLEASILHGRYLDS